MSTFKIGICIIAHGSRRHTWVNRVDQCVAAMSSSLPTVVCFLEMVAGRTIQAGLDTLFQAGVTEVIVVPLFISSGSTHIGEIRALLGLEQQPDIQSLNIRGRIQFCPPMDGHPLIAQLLLNRAAELSQQPSEETLLLVGHGSDVPALQQIWQEQMAALGDYLQQELGFAQIAYATLKPNTIAEQLANLNSNHRLLVLPLFLSAGYFTEKVIPEQLVGLNYTYKGKTYLPSVEVVQWLEQTVQFQLAELEVIK